MLQPNRNDTYTTQKKEATEILRKISNRQLHEMRQMRSSGLQLQQVFRCQILQQARRSQNHYPKNKLPSQYPARKWTQLPFANNSLPDYSVRQRYSANLDLRFEIEEESQLGNDPPASSEEGQQKADRVAERDLQHGDEHFRDQGPNFRPQLRKFIEDTQQVAYQIERKKRLYILQLMILCLIRRQSRKLSSALETIILLYESFKELRETEMTVLKEIWLRLMAKIYHELKLEQLSEQMAKKVRLKSRKQQGEPQQSKRQSSIVIRSMASKRVFFNKFSNSIRKLKLVYESNYRRESRCSDNLLSSGKDSRAVISRCHPSMVISYPEPSKLFPWANNYQFVVVNKDLKNHLFPSRYPKTLEEVIARQDYIQEMAKINQILIPETRCFDYASTLGLEFEYVLLISLVLFLGVVSVAVQSALQWQLAVIGVAFAAILLSSVLLQNKYSNMKNISDIYEKIEVLVRRWENRLPDTRVKICVSENTNALIFAVACVSSLESGSSSSSSDGQAHSAPETISQSNQSGNYFSQQDSEHPMYSKDSHSQAKLKKESSFTVPQDGEQVGEEEQGNTVTLSGLSSESEDEVVGPAEDILGSKGGQNDTRLLFN